MTKFDLTKCFTWQKANTISFKLEDKSKYDSNILSYENFEFSKRLAYKDSLDYSYFVRSGRPFFAYHYFINSQFKKYGKINRTL
jgi:hypothetical protein